MNNWTLFFLTVGITTCAAQLFRIIDWIERPTPARSRRRGGRSA